MTTHDFHRTTRPRLTHPGRQCVRGERRTVRPAGEPRQGGGPVLRPERVRAQGKGVRRMGNPSPPRQRSRLRHRTARHTGNIHGIIVDTAYFKGNYPSFVSIEAASIEGYPSVEESMSADWQTIVEKSPAEGHTANAFAVADRHRWTHVRLSIYPDGGVARLRVHGEVVPDPRFLDGTLDLLAAENGGRLVGCSDAYYASPANIILPGRARNMGAPPQSHHPTAEQHGRGRS